MLELFELPARPKPRQTCPLQTERQGRSHGGAHPPPTCDWMAHVLDLGPMMSEAAMYFYFVVDGWGPNGRAAADCLAYRLLLLYVAQSAEFLAGVRDLHGPDVTLSLAYCNHKYKRVEGSDVELRGAAGGGRRTHFYLLSQAQPGKGTYICDLYHTTMWWPGTFNPECSVDCLSSCLLLSSGDALREHVRKAATRAWQLLKGEC